MAKASQILRNSPSLERLQRRFFARNAESVAQELLGCYLLKRSKNKTLVCRIVETEAYVGAHDLACHASRGKTPRNSVMFGPAGHVYVYFIYGMYEMFNIVTGDENDPQAVLIRAAEMISPGGLDLSGPGKFTRGLKITRRHYGLDLCRDDEMFLTLGTPPRKIIRAKRIGVDYAKKWKNRLLRYYDDDSESVSIRTKPSRG